MSIFLVLYVLLTLGILHAFYKHIKIPDQICLQQHRLQAQNTLAICLFDVVNG